MTKKDFIAIAHTLNANVAPLALVQDFADMLAETNPLFNRQMFVKAATERLLDISHWEAAQVAKSRERV